MIWLIFGALCVVGALLVTIRDTKATEGRPFVDRAPLRRLGGGILAIGGTLLLGYLVLVVLANWVSDDL